MSIEFKILVMVGNLFLGGIMLQTPHKMLAYLNLIMGGLSLIGILGVLAK